MNEMIKILKIIKEILLKPKKAAMSYSLGNYDMKVMNYFIIFISIVFFIALISFKPGPEFSLYGFTVGLIIVSLAVYILRKIIVRIYTNMINSILRYNIPINIMERVLLPYIVTFLILASFIIIIENYFLLPKYINRFIFLIWFNIQVYYIFKYRINNKEMDKNLLTDIRKKLFILTIIILIIGVPSIYVNESVNFKRIFQTPKLNYENPQIREEMYNICYDLFHDIQLVMESHNGLNQSDINEIVRKINSNNIKPLRTNEIDLAETIIIMAKANKAWYEAKKEDNDEEVKIQLNVYKEASNKAKFLMENYKEK
jgi:hypothetical protein